MISTNLSPSPLLASIDAPPLVRGMDLEETRRPSLLNGDRCIQGAMR
jgi:hypothetical protein